MKKKISLDELKVQSFVTSLPTNSNTHNMVGGSTGPEPGSGPCVECIATDIWFTGECACDTSYCGSGGSFVTGCTYTGTGTFCTETGYHCQTYGNTDPCTPGC